MKFWKILIFGVVVLFVAIMTFCNWKSGKSTTIYKLEDSLMVKNFQLIKDSIKMNALSVRENYKNEIKDSFKNNTNIKEAEIEKTCTIFNKKYDEQHNFYIERFENIQNQLMEQNRDLVNLKLARETPDPWLLILLILVSGIIGGFAGPRFALLNDQEKKQVQEFYNSLKSKLNNESIEIDKKIITDTINLLESLSEQPIIENKTFNSLVFGIIASSISFIALRTFDSKILDFKLTTDYFIFFGFGILGATFAKDWIKSIFDRIKK